MRRADESRAGVLVAHDPGAHERGAATVLVVGCCAVTLVLTLLVGLLLSAVRGVAQARSAADLSALAAAGALLDGMRLAGVGHATSNGPPCTVAGWVAERNGARLQSCSLDAGVNVTVTVAVPVTMGGRSVPAPGQATATARAGPAALPGEPEPVLRR